MFTEYFISFFIKNTQNNFFKIRQGKEKQITLAKPKADKNYLLYVHIPFCEECCPYCSFNRYTFNPEIAEQYFKYLYKEINIYKEHGYVFNEIYIGGGTPTVQINELKKLINYLKYFFPVKTISVETNPNHLTKTNLDILKRLQVDRLSVGVQSFDDNILKSIKRYHKYGSGEQIKDYLYNAKDYFKTFNVDMIFNFPGQTVDLLEKDIDTLIDLNIEQVTYYPLMPSSSTANAINNKWNKIDNKNVKYLYYNIVDMFSGYLDPTTIWCFSKNDSLIDEYIINHDEYIGVGSGSFGYMDGAIYINDFSIGNYINYLKNNKLPFIYKKSFTKKEQVQYYFLIKLFGRKLDINAINQKYSIDIFKYLKTETSFFLFTDGIEIDKNYITLTKRGLYFWLIMMKEFFINVNNLRDYCRQKSNSDRATGV